MSFLRTTMALSSVPGPVWGAAHGCPFRAHRAPGGPKSCPHLMNTQLRQAVQTEFCPDFQLPSHSEACLPCHLQNPTAAAAGQQGRPKFSPQGPRFLSDIFISGHQCLAPGGHQLALEKEEPEKGKAERRQANRLSGFGAEQCHRAEASGRGWDWGNSLPSNHPHSLLWQQNLDFKQNCIVFHLASWGHVN